MTTAPPPLSTNPDDITDSGEVAVSTRGKAAETDGGGAAAVSSVSDVSNREYTGRMAYMTLWLVLQPPAVVYRAVAEAVAGRGPVVLRFHRRWWVRRW